ncbi:MAG: hypothetical protein U5J82_03375 [Desulfobacterales bacterium]|nr:hypothetical protein [Desulfobacterales bacterium]
MRTRDHRTKLKGRSHGNTLLITSAKPREQNYLTNQSGNEHCSKQLERTVLMVDADLRNPSKKHKQKNFSLDFLGIEIEKGLSDYSFGAG